MTKRSMAQVLREAADLLPAEDSEERVDCWSCNAALAAEFGNEYARRKVHGGIRQLRERSHSNVFLSELGCPAFASDDTWHGNAAFPDYVGEDLQGVRFMWLHLAALVAEDMGVMCEEAS